MKRISFLLLILSFSVQAHDALVWGGPGACTDGCVDAAVEITKLAGLDPIVVTPENFDADDFKTAKVWVQPGGTSVQASLAMGPVIREQLKQFISNGGGYVGFCAGAFLTTANVGTSTTPGLGIMPGKTELYSLTPDQPSVQPMSFGKKFRFMYWEGGPFFKFTTEELAKVSVTWSYATGKLIAGANTVYGKGRVSVIGTHPEAPQWWYNVANLVDKDGLDHKIAAEMVKWASSI